MSKLIEKYLAAKDAYYAGNPIIDDATFDALEREIAKTAPELLLQIGAPERGGKVPLPAPMGSLNQVFDQAEYSRWAAHYPKTTPLILTEKIDGNSVLLQYRNGVLMSSYSRGNGIQGANNLRHTRLMTNIPQTIKGSFTGLIRGELAIAKADWETVRALATTHSGKDYANARNFTAGFLNGKTGEKDLYKYFKFVAFEIIGENIAKQKMLTDLQKMNFTIPRTQPVTTDATYDALQALCVKMVADSKFEADGIVVDVDQAAHRSEEFDPDDLNPTYAIKIKPPAGTATTTVTHVEWNASKDGLLKPTVHFEPVQLVGVTIRKASGYNAKYVFDNGIGPGAVVAISRRGDVIPRVEEVLVAAEVEQPEHSMWGDTGVDLYTTDSSQQDAINMQILEHFFDKMQVEHVGAGNIAKLYEAGVCTPIDAIEVPRGTYVAAVGSNGGKAFDDLHRKLLLLTPARLFAALGSFGRGMGERKLTALFNVFPFDTVLSGTVTASEITTVDGFEAKTARKILEGVDDAREQFATVGPYIAFMMPKAKPVGGKFSGQVFCPTGVRFTPDIADKIISQGGEITDTFGSKVTTLVAKDPNSGSSKIQKALDKGVDVISLDQLKALL